MKTQCNRSIQAVGFLLAMVVGFSVFAGDQTGMPIAETSTLRLIGFISLEGHTRVVLASTRHRIIQLYEGETERTLVSKTLSGPMEPGKDFVTCERLYPAAGICVLNENSNRVSVTFAPWYAPATDMHVWLTNCPAGLGLGLLGELNQRTMLAPDDLDKVLVPFISCHASSSDVATKEITKPYQDAGMDVRFYGEKWMLGCLSQYRDRYLNVLPPIPTASSGNKTIGRGMIKLTKAPLAQVMAIYGELVFSGRKLTRDGGLPGKQPTISLALQTKATVDEIKHAFDVLLLLNDLKVVPVGDGEFKVIQW